MAVTNTAIGQAANPAALAEALRIFALDNGWALEFTGNNLYALSNDGVVTRVQWNNGTSTANATLTLTGANGVSGGALVNPCTTTAFTNNLIGPYVQHWLYAGRGTHGPYIHGVVEYLANVFAHFGFGRIDHKGSFDGGEYAYRTARGSASSITANAWPFAGADRGVGGAPTGDSHMWVSVNGVGEWKPFRMSSLSYGSPPILDSNTLSHLTFGQNNYNGVAPLWPLLLGGRRPDSTGNYALWGCPPDMRYCYAPAFEPRQIIQWGNDKWRVFPLNEKNGATVVNTGARFFAYLES